MESTDLHIPETILDAIPDDDESVESDMVRAISGWQRQLERVLTEGDDQGDLVDLIDRFESRWEQYDALVAELRAWGQSPIYAIAWRDLHASMIQQLYADESIAARIDRERNARIVENGIRPRD